MVVLNLTLSNTLQKGQENYSCVGAGVSKLPAVGIQNMMLILIREYQVRDIFHDYPS